MVLERLVVFEVAEAGFTEKLLMLVFCDVEEQSLEVLYPRVVALKVQEVDCYRKLLFADVIGSSLSTVVGKSVEVDRHVDDVFDFWNAVRLDWINNLLETMLHEVLIIFGSALWMFTLLDWVESRKNRVAEAALVVVMHIDHRVFVPDVGRKGFES